jgi:hypothetical protein
VMFDCPSVATCSARLQYHGQCVRVHIGRDRNAACTNPLIAAPLASFVHNHVTTTHRNEHITIFNKSRCPPYELLAVPGLHVSDV